MSSAFMTIGNMFGKYNSILFLDDEDESAFKDSLHEQLKDIKLKYAAEEAEEEIEMQVLKNNHQHR